ncbi:EAL domain-containing protein [Rhodoferax sp. PAMC 29310]|uniref:sensor domain-containing protein n=1 Tax=Rhodoferax sp. PAMC 29310 TaxID=2822760 RepID=UPI001B337D31|nr:EAL domain-containing protein [Rhodoferax sp. PAMC 29310]
METKDALLTIQRALAQEQSLLKSLIGAIPDLVWLKDQAGQYLSCNPMFENYLGASEKAILGKTDYDFVDQSLADVWREIDMNAIATPGVHTTNEVWLNFAVGGYRGLFETIKTPAYDNDGRLIGILGVARDITARRLAQEQDRIAAAAFESMDGMVVTDADRIILKINRAFTDSTGYTSEEAVGQTQRLLLASGRQSAEFSKSMWEEVNRNGSWQGEVWDRRKNNEIHPKWLSIKAVKDEAGSITHYVCTHQDITDRKRAAGRIDELAFYDQLTGLPNRTLLLDRLEQRVALGTRDRGLHGLLFIDIDTFKLVNDTLGHGTGDLLLQEVSARLKSCIRDGDTVARLGGDEFVVLMTGLGSDSKMALASAELLAEKIRMALSEPYLLNDIVRHSSASIGVTLFDSMGTDTEELLKQAHLAMDKAKAAGRNTVRFFDPEMQAVVMRHAALEADLRVAVSESQFFLHYQAQATQSGHVTGAEVLVRWAHPVRGMVSPGEFIPLAEETGIIKAIGHWVMETACRQLADWAKQDDMAALAVAVNVSAQQFREPDFVEQVLEILNATGANSKLLKLELTESLLVSDVDEVIQKMLILKEAGVTFSLDDFGTGFSSLTYLKRLPLDQLKIDQSFVRDLLIDPNDAAFVKTIIALAKSLGLAVIAEGVETEGQRNFLAASDCPTCQGYLIHRPSPVAQFETLVKTLLHKL